MKRPGTYILNNTDVASDLAFRGTELFKADFGVT